MPWHHPGSRGSVDVLVVGGVVVLVGTVGAGGGVDDHELFGVARGVAEADEMGQVRGPVGVGAPPCVLAELRLVRRAHFSAPCQGWSPRSSAASHTCTG